MPGLYNILCGVFLCCVCYLAGFYFNQAFINILLRKGGTVMDWTDVINATTFQPILTNITTVMPFIVAFSVAMLGIRKVWKFVKGQASRA